MYLLIFITTVLAISLVFLFMMLCEFDEFLIAASFVQDFIYEAEFFSSKKNLYVDFYENILLKI